MISSGVSRFCFATRSLPGTKTPRLGVDRYLGGTSPIGNIPPVEFAEPYYQSQEASAAGAGLR
jgi:hypothetical protein